MDFIDLYQERDKFRDDIIKVIGQDLNGYVLEDAAIDFLEQTPLDQLDAANILDAQGIRKITQLTAIEHIQTNEFRREEQMKIKKKDVETIETMLELERQQADAEAKQKREIATVQAREKSQTEVVQAEEEQKAKSAQIKKDEIIEIQDQNKQREVEVAQQNRLRVVAVEQEKVERARQIEAVQRERDVNLEKISAEKLVEVEKKNIAEVIRERVSVEKTVAVEEEDIKKVRVVAEAERNRQATIINAEAEAQESLVKEIKAAEADEQKAKHKASEEISLAEGRLKASEFEAMAQIKKAEGIRAIEAAPGLAKVEVDEANAVALEKTGFAEAKVLRVKLEAEAQGKEKIGLAEVNVKKEDASAIVLQGDAEAKRIEAKFKAEAHGLTEKFSAMKEMDSNTRAHEEFRIGIEFNHVENMKKIDANVIVAKERAEILGNAMSKANIDIVVGSGEYFERFVNALSVGNTIDLITTRSETVSNVLKNHLSGDADLVEDFKSIAASLGQGSEGLKNLTISAFLTKVMTDGTDQQKSLVKQLMGSVTGKTGNSSDN